MITARICLALTLSLFTLFTNGQRPYFQQQVDYRIDARLDDSLHQIHATARIRYLNQSPDTLHFIWFHLWPNAYKTERTALGEQLLENGDTRFYFSSAEQKGYINQLDFRVNGMTARTEDHPEHIDIIKLILPEPLPTGNPWRSSPPFTCNCRTCFRAVDMARMELIKSLNGIRNLPFTTEMAGIRCPILTKENSTVNSGTMIYI